MCSILICFTLIFIAYFHPVVLGAVPCGIIKAMNELLEPTNYGTPTSGSIIYNTLCTDDGWRIESRFPRSVPSSDKDSVLKWFEAYRHDIHERYPLWTTSFTMDEDSYCLEIKRNNSARELLNSLQANTATTWGEDHIYGR